MGYDNALCVFFFDAKMFRSILCFVIILFCFVSLLVILSKIFGFKILSNREPISEHAVHTKSL